MPGGAPLLDGAPVHGLSTNMKVAAGCGIFGCLGIAVAGLVLAVTVGMARPSGPSSTGSQGDDPTPRSGGDAPSSGPLRQLVMKQAGAYVLREVSAADPPKDLAPGVQDSLSLKYGGPASVLHGMYAYASPSAANARLDALLGAGAAKPLKNKNGEQIGRIWIGKLKDDQLVAWSNHNLVLLCLGPAPHAAKLTDALSY
jgi:hypothetical protein